MFVRLIATAALVLISGCSDSRNEQAVDINALRADERYDEALTLLRSQMRLHPDDAALRLDLAEVYLDMDEGSLALVALDQAVDRGAPESQTLLPRAAALFETGRFADVIGLQPVESLNQEDRIELQLLRVAALDELSARRDGSDNAVARAYVDLFEELDGDNVSAEWAPSITAVREERTAAERAWQHFVCKNTKSSPITWRPIDRSGSRLLQVGKGRKYATIAAAAAAASDGDIVEIDPGSYVGDVAHWKQNDLIVRGVGGRPHVTANGRGIQKRDVWYFSGNNVVVENVEISGARSAFENGAAIRHTGVGLVLRHVYLHDNENGLLTGNRHPEENTVLIEFSEFARNGDGKGFAHNIYVGRSARFEMQFSYSHSVSGGHLLKSRARHNMIAYNRLTDEARGQSSYIVDIPNGGQATLLGNLIEQGSEPLNHGIVSFAGEDVRYQDSRLTIVNNTLYNRDFEGIGVRNHEDLPVDIINNLFAGAPLAIVDGVALAEGNMAFAEHGMLDPRSYDFRLAGSAMAVDSGIKYSTAPLYEYRHPVMGQKRPEVWTIDVGALENCGL